MIVEHPWTLRPTPQALAAVATMGIFSSALGLMLFYMCLTRLGTLTTNAQGYLRIPIGVGLSVLLLGESVPSEPGARARARDGRRRRDDCAARQLQAPDQPLSRGLKGPKPQVTGGLLLLFQQFFVFLRRRA